MNFKKWVSEYMQENSRELDEWQKETGMKGIIPSEFDKETLRQYIAYKSELHSRRLVWATWGLAIGTLILSGLTLYLTFFTGA